MLIAHKNGKSLKMATSGKRGVVKFHDKKERGDYDTMLLEDNLGLPYVPQQVILSYTD